MWLISVGSKDRRDVCLVKKTAVKQEQSVPVRDEGQGRTGQQLFELMGAQNLAVKTGLPHSGPRPGTVQQGWLTY